MIANKGAARGKTSFSGKSSSTRRARFWHLRRKALEGLADEFSGIALALGGFFARQQQQSIDEFAETPTGALDARSALTLHRGQRGILSE
jgi:CRP-like cAMP-binding protein